MLWLCSNYFQQREVGNMCCWYSDHCTKSRCKAPEGSEISYKRYGLLTTFKFIRYVKIILCFWVWLG